MLEQWQINRAGVINFWYYDDDEFIFDEGRLLLRGANGSGKSVTMQSLVPLLFDGNRSPERLDPFGSRARKMDSYLLSDGLDLDERVGYLFLEFAKKEAGRYLTIGMGMRARKNKPMQTWYFILLDNRRVGHQFDLSLYKDLGEKIPLTQKELENKIGQGGQVFSRQKEYKTAVNEHLFGYEDLSDFDELIELLIQIRSPKLSKEFKPTTMYEIMQNSLITLNDDDLRPMSEAIENMDEIKTKVDALQAAKKSLQKIDGAYSKYNMFVLAHKAQLFTKSYEQEKALKRQLTEYEQKSVKQKKRFDELTLYLEQLEIEEVQVKLKVESLKQHDLSKLAEEKRKEEDSLLLQGAQLEKKEKQLDDHKGLERQLDKNIRDKKTQLSCYQEEIVDILEQMKSLSDDCSFDEHTFFEAEFTSSKGGYNFTFLDHQLNEYKGLLKAGNIAIIKLEGLKRKYDDALKDLDNTNKEKEIKAKDVKEMERLFNEIKAEFIEKMFRWQEENQVLKIPRDVLSKSAESAYKFGDGIYYDQIIAPVRDVYNTVSTNLNQHLSTLKSSQELIKKQWQDKQISLEVLRTQKDPEPIREDKILRNRERLEDAKIPFIPLYKAIDFDANVDAVLKGHIEEALLDLGILDALVVPPKFKEKVLEMDIGMADKYIFAQPEMLSFNLSQYMKPDDYSEKISAMVIDDVLKSIFLDQDLSKFYITEKGSYGMGIIQGHISRNYEAKFIGVQARKRYKQQLMDELSASMLILKDEIGKLQQEIEIQIDLVQQSTKELGLFPKTEDLTEASNDLQSALAEYKRLEGLVEFAEQDSEKIYKELKNQRITVQEKTIRLQLPHKSDVFEQAIEELDSYHLELQGLKLKDKDIYHSSASLESLSEQYNNILSSIEDASDDVHRLEKNIIHARTRIEAINHELSLSDYQEIIAQLDAYISRLKEIPGENKNTIREHERIKSNLTTDEKAFEQVTHEFQKVQRIGQIYEQAFGEEFKLNYVVKEELLVKEEVLINHKLALKMLKTYGTILEEKKQLLERRDELQERLQREGGELLEYNLKRIDLFKESYNLEHNSTDDSTYDISNQQELSYQLQRMDIVAKVSGKEVKFYELFNIIEEQIRENGALLDEQDRELFEDILIKSISRKISSKIYHSEKWVKKINALMEGMNTSSGLSFSLKWLTKKAENEDQLGTKELVEILKMDQGLLTSTHRERLIAHFRSKIQESKNRSGDELEQRSFLTIMKEILDYREWFEFQLHFIKVGEVKKELTNNAFGTFSGGEKAMAMYVPLFSAVYAKYQGGRNDCPKVISLDEAFAGVDDKNIKDMFKLLVELKLSFIANSQVLFGDYETVPALSIYELIRPLNVTFVTTIRYQWNGLVRKLVTEEGV